MIATIAAPLLLLTFATLAFLIVALVVRAVPQAPSSVFPDIIRTSLGVGAGFAATYTLVLAARRQWSNEDIASKNHQQREEEKSQREEIARAEQADRQTVADDTRFDAEERRSSDSFSRAIEQIGHDKAPVRMAGLYSLERLGRESEARRAVIVNVVCGYLRMPYEPPGSKPDPSLTEGFALWEQREQELNVRRVAEQIVGRHRRLDGGEDFWSIEDPVDLTYAHLLSPNFAFCSFPHARLAHAHLIGAKLGYASLQGARLLSADLAASDLVGANLSHAVVGDTDFRNCNMNQSTCTGVEFLNCDLRFARLRGADLSGADLSAARLGSGDESVALGNALWSEETKWPESMRTRVLEQSTTLEDRGDGLKRYAIRPDFGPLEDQ